MPLTTPNSSALFFDQIRADMRTRGMDNTSPEGLASAALPYAQMGMPGITMDTLLKDAKNFFDPSATTANLDAPAAAEPAPYTFNEFSDYGLQDVGPHTGWWTGSKSSNVGDDLANARQWLTTDNMAKERAFPVMPWMTFNENNPQFQQALDAMRNTGDAPTRFDVGHAMPDQGLDLSYGVQHKGRGGGYVVGGFGPDYTKMIDEYMQDQAPPRPETMPTLGDPQAGPKPGPPASDLGSIYGYSAPHVGLMASYLGNAGFPAGPGLMSLIANPMLRLGVDTAAKIGSAYTGVNLPTGPMSGFKSLLGGGWLGKQLGITDYLENKFPLSIETEQGPVSGLSPYGSIYGGLMHNLRGQNITPEMMADPLFAQAMFNAGLKFYGSSANANRAGWTDTYNLTRHPNDAGPGGTNFGPTSYSGVDAPGYSGDSGVFKRGGKLRSPKYREGAPRAIKAHEGEYVVNRQATKAFEPVLEAMNQVGLGDPRKFEALMGKAKEFFNV